MDVQKRKKRAEANQTRRVIKHPNFHNFNLAQAEAHLDKQQRGDVVIRPSSKGQDHLFLNLTFLSIFIPKRASTSEIAIRAKNRKGFNTNGRWRFRQHHPLLFFFTSLTLSLSSFTL